MKAEDFRPYLSMSEDELYAELARTTVGAEMLPQKLQDLIDLGKLRFQTAKKAITGKICRPAVRKALKAERDSEKLAVAIGEILSTAALGIPIVLISSLVVKIGLDALCPKASRQPAP
jgi:hypothetical protein